MHHAVVIISLLSLLPHYFCFLLQNVVEYVVFNLLFPDFLDDFVSAVFFGQARRSLRMVNVYFFWAVFLRVVEGSPVDFGPPVGAFDLVLGSIVFIPLLR